MNVNVKGVKQRNIEDCGAACLATIFKIYHSDIALQVISEKLQVDCGGASIYGLIKVAKEYGLLGEALEGTFEELLIEVENRNVTFPIIAHVIKDEILEHYVVIKSINEKKCKIFDPAVGDIEYEIEEFQKIWNGYIITFEKMDSFQCHENKKHYLKKCIQFMKPLRPWIIGIFILSVLISVLSITGAYAYQYIVDYYILDKIPTISSNKYAHITDGLMELILNNPGKFFLLLLSLYLFQGIVNFVKELCSTYYTKHIAEKLAEPFYIKLISLPTSFFQNKKTGEIISRFQDIENTKKFLSEDVVGGFIDLFMAIIGGFALVQISKILFSIVCITLLVYFIVVILFLNPIKRTSEKVMDSYSEMMGVFKENIDSIEIIKTHGLEQEKTKNILKKNQKFINVNFQGNILWNKLSILIALIEQVGMLFNLWIGARLIFNNSISLGEFLAFESLTYYFTEPLKNIVILQMEIQKWIVSLQRVNDIIEATSENDIYRKESVAINVCDIKLEHVSFAYGYRENTLTDINLWIKSGEKIAITGKSGSGKSSLAKLINAFYYTDEGKILIDGTDIKEIDVQYLRSHIMYIPQSIKLFSGTLKDNLLLNSNMDKVQFEKVIKGCFIDEIIKDTELGIHSIIGEEGKNLSGGQRQRIAIAQALLKNPDVMIFDESTNQLDDETERSIIDFILKEYVDCTCIFISHNKNIWNLCERKIELDHGKIIN